MNEAPRVDQARRITRELEQLDTAVKRLGTFEKGIRDARTEVYDLAGRLHADGFSWRQLAALTGISHVALMAGFQRVVDEQLSKLQ